MNSNGSVTLPVQEGEKLLTQTAVLPKTGRIVAVCGTAGNSRQEIMTAPANWEMWALSKSHEWMPRVDVIFEMHDRPYYPHVYTPDHVKWLAEQTRPIYCHSHYDDIPASIRFPREAVLEGKFSPYYSSSISYMLALAVHQRVDEIRLLGVNMATDSEYAYQRGSCEYWIGIAQALGIPVYLPGVCPLTKELTYGLDAPMRNVERKLSDWTDQIKRQIHHMYEECHNEQRRAVAEFETFLVIQDYLESKGLPTEDRTKASKTFLDSLDKRLSELGVNLNGCAGALQLLEKMHVQNGAPR
jgi:hypothetical protein